MSATKKSSAANNHKGSDHYNAAEKNNGVIPANPLEQFSNNMASFGEQYHKLWQAYGETANANDYVQALSNQMHIGAAFMKFYSQMWSEPTKAIETHIGWLDDYLKLLATSACRLSGEECAPVISPDQKDKRFKDAAWNDHPAFDFFKQFYLLAAKRIDEAVSKTEGLDPQTAHKVAFYTQQFINALSPSNFLFTNPEALRATLETHGENLVRGMENLVKDIASGQISMTDVEAFEVGKNIACTPGKVVFRNDLIELLQYEPKTEKVYSKPLLIIPAWINKYYILDLKPENSLVNWLVGQGYTVFMISWVNPDERQREKTFDDYMLEGPLAAAEEIEKITGEKEICAMGYCLGGTLLAITQAWLGAKGKKRFASTTFLTTMTDFTKAGDLAVFVDEDQIKSLEERMSASGYLDGREMAQTFNLLRSNDLIWHFVINNYLLGKDPFPFDLLYWNTDSTRMPAKMHSFYLRNMYQKNLLPKPGAIKIAGQAIDLGKVSGHSYMLSTREDHIAPWQSTYRATQYLGGKIKFVLADSGHVAGVVNPPAKQKYCFWTAGDKHPANADDWFKTAAQNPGSWWPDWVEWNKAYAGDKIPARKPAKGLGDAPGEYVKVRV